MLHIIETSKFPPVLAAGNNLLAMIHTGKLFSESEEDKNAAIVATDRLEEHIAVATRELADATHAASPFLRYRKEIMGGYSTAVRLQNLVLNLWNSNYPCQNGQLLANADAHHKRIALELFASYARHGENDPHFMAMADEIRDERQAQKVAA